MVDRGIHIGVKAVLARSGDVPGIQGLLFGEADARNGLGTFETVFPRKDDAQRRSILVGKILAIHAEAKQSERMHGLIHAESFDIGPLENLAALAGHLSHIQDCGELHEFCLAGGINTLDEFTERKPDPGNNDRPPLHAAMAIDALLGSCHLDDCIHIEFLLLGHRTFDFDFPRARTKILG